MPHVLISGANGYIAVWVVRTLLEEGFSVRGAVCSAEKGKHLSELFAPYGDKFELAIVPDITALGAFDEAVQGVDAIEHTASPFHFQADNPAELLEPAIKGTVGILESARKYGKGVKRIVVTSSCAAVMNISTEPQVLSELDWNDQAVKEVEERGRAASAGAKYRTSKTLAERAAWDFVETHKAEIGWDLSVLNLPLVLGPILHAIASPTTLNTSTCMMYDAFTKPGSAAGGGCWIDVRALQRAAAGGERIIIAVGAFAWQDWLDAAPAGGKYQKGTPGAGKDAVHLLRYRNEKSVRVLGMEYRSMADTAKAVVADWEARGW
ncbi:D-lactaldehyde dehydrogenase [Mycena rosella]|uniref:D-lactaldehyde dehydrogenase n=1 Tax=Mycena rosella TaxID=1033263 RepID=A0AAD7CVP3_MYCRO|nr:D-lactaldehyde dehydrogenase [Mycena rosella]